FMSSDCGEEAPHGQGDDGGYQKECVAEVPACAVLGVGEGICSNDGDHHRKQAPTKHHERESCIYDKAADEATDRVAVRRVVEESPQHRKSDPGEPLVAQ